MEIKNLDWINKHQELSGRKSITDNELEEIRIPQSEIIDRCLLASKKLKLAQLKAAVKLLIENINIIPEEDLEKLKSPIDSFVK